MPDLSDEEARRIVSTPSSLEGTDERKADYIKAMLDVIREDIRHTLLRVTAALATTVILTTQIPFDRVARLPSWTRWLLVGGIVSMALSATSYFLYVRRLHITQMSVARCIPSLDVVRVRELWAGKWGVWQQYKLYHHAGTLFLIAGAILIGVIMGYAIINAPSVLPPNP